MKMRKILGMIMSAAAAVICLVSVTAAEEELSEEVQKVNEELEQMYDEKLQALEEENAAAQEGVSSTEILFRDHEWGDKKQTVIEKEVEDLSYRDYMVSDNQLRIYYGSVGGYDAEIVFIFNDEEELTAGGYVLTEGHHLDKNEFFADYCDLVEQYKDKYGEPGLVIEDWKQERYRYDKNRIGYALLCKDVEFETAWIDENGSQINMCLYGQDLDVCTTITYTNSAYTSKDTSGI